MSEAELTDLGLGPYLHQQPSLRLPVYTRGNAGEVWPEVAYPLSVSMSTEVAERAYRAAALESGLFTEADLLDGASSFGGCFGGYMYINLSFSRLAAIRMPGVSIEEHDATFLGSEDISPPHVPRDDDKNLVATIRGLRYGWQTLRAKSLPEVEADRAFLNRRLSALTEPSTLSDLELAHRFDTLFAQFGDLFARHLVVTGKAGAMVGALSSMCEDRLGDRSLALTMLGGLGGVDSAAPSFDLWTLGRRVRADPRLAAMFDEGTDGLWHRLRAAPNADAFVQEFTAFLDAYGARGPNEWESACETWGTKPDMALALVDRMRGADERQAPAIRAARLAGRREEAIDQARSALTGPARWLFNQVLAAAIMYSQGRERTKTTVVEAVHAIRLSNRELGARLARRSGGEPDDLYFVLRGELDHYIEEPGAFADLIAQRRSTREALAARVPPFVFDGEMPRADTWPLRGQPDSQRLDALAVGDVVEGLPGCPGVAEGRAKVIMDPSLPRDLGPGDVLVAPLTDPAWTPLFVPSEAVVVDVGGQMSHAVIVSRELGLPCVVAATGATTRIPDGALVRVDGAAGTVTVLELP